MILKTVKFLCKAISTYWYTINRDCSRADLRSVYRFWGHLIWTPKFKKGRKRKTNIFLKNKKLPSLIVFGKLNIELEHINAANSSKNSIIVLYLCFRQYLDKKVGASCPELSTILKILPLGANHGGVSV